MSLIVVLLLALAAYTIYVMLDSYRQMARELREIRLQCAMGATQRSDPMVTIKDRLIAGLEQAKSLA